MRIQSPSSISAYKKCPRKYFYGYIAGLKTLPNIHQVRGNIVHSVLENFFDMDVRKISNGDYEQKLKTNLQMLLLEEWGKKKKTLQMLNLSKAQEIFYFEESLLMLFRWIDDFLKRIEKRGDFQTAFKQLTPIREKTYLSSTLHAKGVIDAIEEIGAETRLVDYKTSSIINVDEHKLQLAIYSLLYFENHGKLPDKAGVYFLRKGELHFIDIDDELLEFAKREIELIHEKTTSQDKKEYPKNITRLCNYCEFYYHCINDD